MADKKNKLALVTGASGGIGLEFVKQLAARGHDIILVSRNNKKLTAAKMDIEKKYGVRGFVISADLSESDSAEKIFQECQKQRLTVDILVNNAGRGLCVESILHTTTDANALLTLNILSLTNMCILFGKSMADRGTGHILNVGSMAGKNAIPFFASYSASKNYVLAYSIALTHELKSKGVAVTCLMPGFVQTDFDDNSNITSKNYIKMSNKSGMLPDKVAEIGIKSMFKKRIVATPGFSNKLTVFFNGLIPQTLSAGIMRGYLTKLMES